MSHANAALTPRHRLRLARLVVEESVHDWAGYTPADAISRRCTSLRAAGVDVTTAAGNRLTGDQALFAMGAHSAFDLPVPADEPFTIYARTVVHVPLSDAQAAQLSELPCMIVRGVDDESVRWNSMKSPATCDGTGTVISGQPIDSSGPVE